MYRVELETKQTSYGYFRIFFTDVHFPTFVGFPTFCSKQAIYD